MAADGAVPPRTLFSISFPLLKPLTDIARFGSTAQTPPVFAKDFYVGSQSVLGINQGGYYIQDGICCSSEHSSGCKLQFINQGEDVYEQGTTERSRSDSARGAIVNWYGNVSKQMAIVPGAEVNSTHKWACVQYCPITDGSFESILQVGDGQKGPLDTPKDLGKEFVKHPKSIGGDAKSCEHWQWSETIFKVIKMQTTDFFVDNSGKTPSPFFTSSFLTPFGSPLGQENASFIGYQAMDVSDYFDIDMHALKGTCPMSDQCNPPSSPAPSMTNDDMMHDALLEALAPNHFARQRFWPKKSLLEEATEQAALMAAAPIEAMIVNDDPTQPNITFVSDFIAHEKVVTLINQGGVKIDGDICCSADTPFPQCQVQYQHQEGTRYLDVTNQRIRFEDVVSGETVVDDFTAHKSMLINVTGGVETCQEYCPIKADDKLYPIDPFDPFDKTVDKGATTMGGKNVEHYFWADKILKFLTMSTTNFYADISNKKAAVPVFSSNHLTPLGQDLGFTNQSWSNFTAGTPPAAKFKIAGMATCPQSSKCQQSKMLAHHLVNRNYHTLASLMESRLEHPVMHK